MYGFQCCCNIQNRPICNLAKLISLECGDISRENLHYRIQDIIVIIDHCGETCIEQGGVTRGGQFNEETLEKGPKTVPVVVDGGE